MCWGVAVEGGDGHMTGSVALFCTSGGQAARTPEDLVDVSPRDYANEGKML